MGDRQTDYLKEYDATPAAKQYPLVQKWMKEEPLPFFRQLRDQRPILVTPECTLVARFSDIRDALQMPRVFTVNLYKSKMGVTETEEGYLMAHDDDALHYREKSLMQGFLNRDDLPVVRKRVGETADDILNRAGGRIEIVNAFCRQVPAHLVQDYFGLDGIDREKLIHWSFWNQYDAFHNQPFDLNSKEKSDHIIRQHGEVTTELVAYIAVLMGRKVLRVKLEPFSRILLFPWRALKTLIRKMTGGAADYADDMVLRMLRSKFAREVDFPLTRIGVNAGGLLIGAIETTSQAVSQSIAFLLQHPELLAKAKAAAAQDDPAAFDGLVWETLRYVPISPYMFRQTSEDYSLAKGTAHETTIPRGTNVLLLTQSAMFDPYCYDNPEAFDPNRNWYHHFNFGFGSHECLGKYVGMVMIPEMVRQVVKRSELASLGPIDYQDGPFPECFHLTWT